MVRSCEMRARLLYALPPAAVLLNHDGGGCCVGSDASKPRLSTHPVAIVVWLDLDGGGLCVGFSAFDSPVRA
jgi:hypothetical protein